MIEFGHLSHVGLRRELNEDTYYGDADLGLWLVADGMGGHEFGEVASALARDAVVREIRAGKPLQGRDPRRRRGHHQAVATARRKPADGHDDGGAAFGRQPFRTGLGRRQPRLPVERRAAPAFVRPQLRAGTDRPGRDHAGTGAHPPASQRGDAGARRHRPGEPQGRDHFRRAAPRLPDPAVQRRPDRRSERRARIASLLAQAELSAQECVDHLVSAALDGGGSDNVTVVLLRRV